jgi:hypothetical protein
MSSRSTQRRTALWSHNLPSVHPRASKAAELELVQFLDVKAVTGPCHVLKPCRNEKVTTLKTAILIFCVKHPKKLLAFT